MTKENGIVKVFSKWKMIVTTIGAIIGIIITIFNIMLADYPTKEEVRVIIEREVDLLREDIKDNVDNIDKNIDRILEVVLSGE